jgi:hypothetical protein
MRNLETVVADNNDFPTTTLFLYQQQWFQQEDDALEMYVLSFLDVKTLFTDGDCQQDMEKHFVKRRSETSVAIIPKHVILG